jgi:hypothetical protein
MRKANICGAELRGSSQKLATKRSSIKLLASPNSSDTASPPLSRGGGSYLPCCKVFEMVHKGRDKHFI